jgi:hypothetical protein
MTDPKHPIPPNIIEALKRGDQVEAIKLLRQAAKGMGLAEAKAALDQLRQAAAAQQAKAANAARPGPAGRTTIPHKHVVVHAGPRRMPGLSPGEVPRASGSGAGIVVVLAIGALLAWYYLR